MIYFYLICAICVITLVFTGIQGLIGLYRMIDPESELMEYEWRSYSDIDYFKRSEDFTPKRRPIMEPAVDTARQEIVMTDAEWNAAWEKYRELLIEGKRREGRKQLVYLLISAIVCVPFFLLHWRYARRYAGINEGDNSIDKRSSVG